ncbi:DUF4012 domain-containing protein [Mycetocola zhadangensis]|uniref:DUF4012 domain-containing protein n=1 Tax=Mycetocola zhadangensis TaxID=1164595 RepID=UPI003A4D8853
MRSYFYPRPRRAVWVWGTLAFVVVLGAAVLWIGVRGIAAADELRAAKTVAQSLREKVIAGDTDAATVLSESLAGHTNRAVELTSDPVWRAAEFLPFVGKNLLAVGQSARIVDGLAVDVTVPLIPIADGLDLSAIAGTSVDLAPLAAAAPALDKAYKAVIPIREEARAVNADVTLPFIRRAVDELKALVDSTAESVEVLNRAAILIPPMLGGSGPRNYLLLVQNSAELRASGGVVGATAVLSVSEGEVTISGQKSAAEFPLLPAPILPLTAAEGTLYGDGIGRDLEAVNLTPDFARTAELAVAMAQPVYGTTFDGVLAIDPYVLQLLLTATGPVSVNADLVLSEKNVVQLLLTDVYRDLANQQAQESFFAVMTDAVLNAVMSDNVSPRALLAALLEGASDGRILLWSADSAEQAMLAETTLAGSLRPSAEGFVGVYLNDATGGKMDVYVTAATKLGCAPTSDEVGGTRRATITLSSSAPADAATALPAAVTGEGQEGILPGHIRTQVVVVLPPDAVVVSATRGDEQPAVVARDDEGRSVVTMPTEIAPGGSVAVTIDFTAAQIATISGTAGIDFLHAEPVFIPCSVGG